MVFGKIQQLFSAMNNGFSWFDAQGWGFVGAFFLQASAAPLLQQSYNIHVLLLKQYSPNKENLYKCKTYYPHDHTTNQKWEKDS